MTRARIDADTRLPEAAAVLVGACLDDVAALAAAARSANVSADAALADAEVIHDLRVATRQLRAALWLLGDEPLRRLGHRVKRLQDALGAVRDRQLLLAWLDDAAARATASPAAVAARARLARELAAARRALRPALARFATTDAPAIRVALAAHAGRGRLGGPGVRGRLERRRRRLDAELAALVAAPAPAPAPARAHAARIAAKKRRDALALVAPALGKGLRREARALRRLIRALGESHDADLRLAWLAGRRGLGSLVTIARAAVAAATKTARLEARRYQRGA